MSSQPAPTNPQHDSANSQAAPQPAEHPPEPESATVQAAAASDDEGVAPEELDDFKLPDPDPDNITVLTNKLPNKPILPWNRYDSPGKEEEDAAEAVEGEVAAEHTAADATQEPVAAEDAEGEIEVDEVE